MDNWSTVSALATGGGTPIAERHPIPIDLLYSDLEGGQRTVTRIVMTPKHEGDKWITSVSRHWYLDQANPR
jgi:hypothetical protein